MENKKIGERIKKARKSAGLSLEELANSADVNKSTMLRYENGEILNIKLPTLEAIAKKLDVNTSWLLYKSDVAERGLIEEEVSEIADLLKKREDLMELFRIAVAAKPEEVEKMIAVFKALQG